MNLKVITRNIGLALLLSALFMYISAIVSAIYNFDASFSPLLLSAFITSVAGAFPLIFVKKSSDINIREGFVIVVSAWSISCFFGMLPYVLYGGEFSIINSWFESVSGYTTTGSTILLDIESLPKGLLFWRSSTHWLGGLGVVVFMLLILPSVSSFRLRLSKMEISSLSRDNFRFKVNQTIRIIFYVYLGLTVLQTILLDLAGMDLFDAINHSFSTIATGGFSTKNQSIMQFNSFTIELIIMAFMVLAGIHFGLLYSIFIGKPGNLFRSAIVRFYLVSLIVGGVGLSLNIWFSGTISNFITAFRQGFFQLISIATTTGFATADSSVWPSFSILILIYFSFQTACSGSTTGGLKADRVYIFFASIRAQLRKQIHPNAVVSIKVNNHSLDREVVSSVNLYIALYIMVVFVVTLLLSLMGINLEDSFTSSVACMGNVGPGFGSIGSLGNYSHFPTLAKLLLSIEMIFGRLEIYSIMVIFLILRWR
ncbi:MAG: TrkH family potassium uptake protein [Bacteroidales bacterium]|nr:TrkH family potassium uptake protein [Bacteroidales bacterium]